MNDILKEIEKAENLDGFLNNTSIFEINKEYLENILSSNVYGKRFVRYILLKNEYLSGDNTVHISDYKTISVEHVLPQNPKDGSAWNNNFNDEEKEKWTHKLANLILINRRKNSKLSNLDFQEKKERYFKGKIDIFPSSKIFANYEGWDVSILEKRQKGILNSLISNKNN